MTKRIAIIGGGPKAAAVVSLVKSLAESGFEDVPNIDVWEPNGFGAHWDGGNGYTDGARRLCTSPNRDVGFPYDVCFLNYEHPDAPGSASAAGAFPLRVEAADAPSDTAHGYKTKLFEDSSWLKFTRSFSEIDADFLDHPFASTFRYDNWVARECPRPTHRVFAAYIAWVIERALQSPLVDHVPLSVGGLSFEDGKWVVTGADGDRETVSKKYDEVVVSGAHERPIHDKTKTIVSKKVDLDRYFTGSSFWNELDRFDRVVRESIAGPASPINVAIAGSGGACAEIAAHLHERYGHQIEVQIVGSSAYMLSRASNFTVDRAFSDPTHWANLSLKQRRQLVSTFGRATVWQAVSERLERSSSEHVPRKVVKIKNGERSKIALKLDRPLSLDGIHGVQEKELICDVVINASGFDACWFWSLLSNDLKARLSGKTVSPKSKWDAKAKAAFEKRFRDALRTATEDDFLSQTPVLGDFCLSPEVFEGFPPGFHVPALGDIIHPAAPNLMALGAIAELLIGEVSKSPPPSEPPPFEVA